jgi:site-specific DNA-cytosine methylase
MKEDRSICNNIATGILLELSSLNVQERYLTPFLKMEVSALRAAGYRDVAWREVSSEAFGLPNPKKHIILMASDGLTALVDCCLFSTVCPRQDCALVCAAHIFNTLHEHAGAGALSWLQGYLLPVRHKGHSGRRGLGTRVGLRRYLWTLVPHAAALAHHKQPRSHGDHAPRARLNYTASYLRCRACTGHAGRAHLLAIDTSRRRSLQPTVTSDAQIPLCR